MSWAPPPMPGPVPRHGSSARCPTTPRPSPKPRPVAHSLLSICLNACGHLQACSRMCMQRVPARIKRSSTLSSLIGSSLAVTFSLVRERACRESPLETHCRTLYAAISSLLGAMPRELQQSTPHRCSSPVVERTVAVWSASVNLDALVYGGGGTEQWRSSAGEPSRTGSGVVEG